MSLTATSPDERDVPEQLRSLFNAGWSEVRLARHFGMAISWVRKQISGFPARPSPLHGLPKRPGKPQLVVTYPMRRERFDREWYAGDGLPAFANDAGHVAAVMAAGGFVSLTEHRQGAKCRLGLPLRRPVYEGPGA